MKILKFGGTSLGTAARIRTAAKIIESTEDCIVVCSAMAGVTDALVELNANWACQRTKKQHDILTGLFAVFSSAWQTLTGQRNIPPVILRSLENHKSAMLRTLSGTWSPDKEKWILAQGEIITVQIFWHFLLWKDINIRLLDSLLFIKVNAHGDPAVESVRESVGSITGGRVKGRYITQGYICLDHNNQISNLKRGGSDYTATLLGAATGAGVIEIWTDIDGIRNNDPRHIASTQPVREISYREASELAYFGAKILHPVCVWPAEEYAIPIRIKCIHNTGLPGTYVSATAKSNGIRAISAKDGITVIQIRSGRMVNAYGFLKNVFAVFEKWGTSVDVITTSEVSISVTIDQTSNIHAIRRDLEKLGQVSVEKDRTIICIVGDIMGGRRSYAALVLQSLEQIRADMISYGSSSNNITIVLPKRFKQQALESLHGSIFSDSTHHHASLCSMQSS